MLQFPPSPRRRVFPSLRLSLPSGTSIVHTHSIADANPHLGYQNNTFSYGYRRRLVVLTYI
jgi:hypothetical protein